MKWCLTSIVISSLMLTACQVEKPTSSATGGPAKVSAEAAHVAVKDVPYEVIVPASIESQFTSRLTTKITAHVAEIHADIGDQVKAGQPLISLIAPELDEEVRREAQRVIQAEQRVIEQQASMARIAANLDESTAQLAAAEATIALRRSQWQRIQQLVSFGALQESREEEARFALLAAEADEKEVIAQIRAGQAAINESEEKRRTVLAEVQVVMAARAQAMANASYLVIRAPFDGLVTERTVAPGEVVRPTDSGGATLMTVEKVNPLRLVMFLPLKEAGYLNADDEVRLHDVTRIGNEVITKVGIRRFARAFDRNSRMMRAEAELKNPQQDGSRQFRPGDYGKATVVLHVFEKAIVVPGDAVGQAADGAYIMKIDAARICQRIGVKIVYQDDDSVVVEPLHVALREGDLVISKNPSEFHDRQQLDEVSIEGDH